MSKKPKVAGRPRSKAQVRTSRVNGKLGGRPKQRRRLADYKVPEEMPDELECIREAFYMQLMSMRQVARSRTITDQHRRDELRKTGKVMVALVSKLRLRRAEAVIREHHAQTQAAVDPALSPPPAAPTARGPDVELVPPPDSEPKE